MIQAIEMHGLKGVLMELPVSLRCHPLSETGDDPVPDYFSLKLIKLLWMNESKGVFLCLSF